MRMNAAVFCCLLVLGLCCAMTFATTNLMRSAAPESAVLPPVQQNVAPANTSAASNAQIAPASQNASYAAAAVSPEAAFPVAASSRELVRPTVTLKNQRISIQMAATQVCAQAGMRYDFSRSKEKAGDRCRQYIQVNLENATLDEALAQIVLKNGLRYRTEGQLLWLETPE